MSKNEKKNEKIVNTEVKTDNVDSNPLLGFIMQPEKMNWQSGTAAIAEPTVTVVKESRDTKAIALRFNASAETAILDGAEERHLHIGYDAANNRLGINVVEISTKATRTLKKGKNSTGLGVSFLRNIIDIDDDTMYRGSLKRSPSGVNIAKMEKISRSDG